MPEYTPDISIVVPVYNSENTLPELVARIDKTMNELSLWYELILCDDRSTDKSWNVIKEICSRHNGITGLRMVKNTGQWCSTLAGISKASAKYIVTIDDDLEYDPGDIAKLYKRITSGNYQVVFGIARDKYIKQGGSQQLSAWRNKLLNLLWNKGVTDSFKILNRSLVFTGENFLPDIPFEAFITHNLSRNFWGYSEVGFHERYSGHSNHSFLKKVELFFLYSSYYLNNPVKYIAASSVIFFMFAFVIAAIIIKFPFPYFFSLLFRFFSFLGGLLIIFLIMEVFFKAEKFRPELIEGQTI